MTDTATLATLPQLDNTIIRVAVEETAMKLRTLLTAGAGTLGVAAASNRLLAARAQDLENPLPGAEYVYRWRGMDIVYTELGDSDNPDIVLFHGIHAAASGDEFSAIVEHLAETYHVIVPDLPGFGRTDRPPLVYSATLYEEFVQDFLNDIAVDPLVVASSLTGSYVAAVAAETDCQGLVLICPTAETSDDKPWLRTLLRTPLVGTALFNLLVSKPSLKLFFDRDGYYDVDNLGAEELEYAWHSAHQPGARYAPASFAAGMLDPDIDLATELAALEIPVTLVWGRDAELIPLRDGRQLADSADTGLIVVDYATLLPHAEHPETVVDSLEAELPKATE